METPINHSEKAAKTLSKVGKKSKRAPISGGIIILGILVLLLFLGASFPHKSKASPETQEEKNSDHSVLTQNLETLDSLRHKKEDPKPVVSTQSEPRHYGPPKLKTKPSAPLLSKELRLRMSATTHFDITPVVPKDTINASYIQTPDEKSLGKTLIGHDENSQFLNEQNGITAVLAKKTPHPDLTVPAGEMIAATLETAINSDLPGMVRAITTRDIYSLTGSHCLIPKGSSLIGQFNSNIVEGQVRIFVVWTRVGLSNGLTVMLNSPSADAIGRAGQGPDWVNRHFFERFGESALLSVLGAYSAMAGVGTQDQYNSLAQYRMAIANSFQQTAGQTLEKSSSIKPTIDVHQGAEINVFVAHDLDFSVAESNLSAVKV